MVRELAMTIRRTTLGFDRKLRLGWLDAAALGLRAGDDVAALRARLRGVLAGEVRGESARGALDKTLTVLLRVWCPTTAPLRSLRDEALRLHGEIASDEGLWLHWGMILATHPFALDVATQTGRLLALQDDVSVGELNRRMVERWGASSTLDRALQRTLGNMIDWGVLAHGARRGLYCAVPRRTSPSPEVTVWMIEALLRAQGVPCASLRQIESAPALFPFALKLLAHEMRRSSRVELFRQGVDMDMLALR